jgi:hypothetical protein
MRRALAQCERERDVFIAQHQSCACEFAYGPVGWLARLQCLSSVAIALGDAFARYAPTMFARCVRLIFQTLQHVEAFDAAQAVRHAHSQRSYQHTNTQRNTHTRIHTYTWTC